MSSNLKLVILLLVTLLTFSPTSGGRFRIRIPVVVPVVVPRSYSNSGYGESNYNYNPPRSDSDFDSGGSHGFQNPPLYSSSPSHDSGTDVVLWICIGGAILLFLIGLPILYCCIKREKKNRPARARNERVRRWNPNEEAERGQLFGIRNEEGEVAAIGWRSPQGDYILMGLPKSEEESEAQPSRVQEITEGPGHEPESPGWRQFFKNSDCTNGEQPAPPNYEFPSSGVTANHEVSPNKTNAEGNGRGIEPTMSTQKRIHGPY